MAPSAYLNLLALFLVHANAVPMQPIPCRTFPERCVNVPLRHPGSGPMAGHLVTPASSLTPTQRPTSILQWEDDEPQLDFEKEDFEIPVDSHMRSPFQQAQPVTTMPTQRKSFDEELKGDSPGSALMDAWELFASRNNYFKEDMNEENQFPSALTPSEHHQFNRFEGSGRYSFQQPEKPPSIVSSSVPSVSGTSPNPVDGASPEANTASFWSRDSIWDQLRRLNTGSHPSEGLEVVHEPDERGLMQLENVQEEQDEVHPIDVQPEAKSWEKYPAFEEAEEEVKVEPKQPVPLEAIAPTIRTFSSGSRRVKYVPFYQQEDVNKLQQKEMDLQKQKEMELQNQKEMQLQIQIDLQQEIDKQIEELEQEPSLPQKDYNLFLKPRRSLSLKSEWNNRANTHQRVVDVEYDRNTHELDIIVQRADGGQVFPVSDTFYFKCQLDGGKSSVSRVYDIERYGKQIHVHVTSWFERCQGGEIQIQVLDYGMNVVGAVVLDGF